jgi:hypothetical protein
MLGVAKSLPEDPEELRRFTALLLAEVKSQAMLIEKLRTSSPVTAAIALARRRRPSSSVNWRSRQPRSPSLR